MALRVLRTKFVNRSSSFIIELGWFQGWLSWHDWLAGLDLASPHNWGSSQHDSVRLVGHLKQCPCKCHSKRGRCSVAFCDLASAVTIVILVYCLSGHMFKRVRPKPPPLSGKSTKEFVAINYFLPLCKSKYTLLTKDLCKKSHLIRKSGSRVRTLLCTPGGGVLGDLGLGSLVWCLLIWRLVV